MLTHDIVPLEVEASHGEGSLPALTRGGQGISSVAAVQLSDRRRRLPSRVEGDDAAADYPPSLMTLPPDGYSLHALPSPTVWSGAVSSLATVLDTTT